MMRSDLVLCLVSSGLLILLILLSRWCWHGGRTASVISKVEHKGSVRVLDFIALRVDAILNGQSGGSDDCADQQPA
jgi:hypothetical protein